MLNSQIMNIKTYLLIILIASISYMANGQVKSDSSPFGVFLMDYPGDMSKDTTYLQFVSNDMSKGNRNKLQEANYIYQEAWELIKSKNSANDEDIAMMQESINMYKKAKVNDENLNYIYINLAYSCAISENYKPSTQRYLSRITSKIENKDDVKWVYNMGIIYSMCEDLETTNSTSPEIRSSIKLLSKAIQLEEECIDAYTALSALYRKLSRKENDENARNAEKVHRRKEIIEAKIEKRNTKEIARNNQEDYNNQEDFADEREYRNGRSPKIQDLHIQTYDRHLAYNKNLQYDKTKLEELSREGILSYDRGALYLKNKDYEDAVDELTNALQQLKKAKVSEHGLNFSRGNLAIACLASGDFVSQAKKPLLNITDKLYTSSDENPGFRNWTYNIAVANYEYGIQIINMRIDKETKPEKWLEKLQESAFIKQAIKLFKLSIHHDKYYIQSYENLVHIYNELEEYDKAESYEKKYIKYRNELLNSMTREEQKRRGIDGTYIFRIQVGGNGYKEYEAPSDLFDEEYIITIPRKDNKLGNVTVYLVGNYENLEEAEKKLKSMKKRGYESATIKVYRDGERINMN